MTGEELKSSLEDEKLASLLRIVMSIYEDELEKYGEDSERHKGLIKVLKKEYDKIINGEDM